MLSVIHQPVLLQKTIEMLAVQPGGRYIDCTVGGGGHARAILEESAPGGQLLGIDADPQAIGIASCNLAAYRDSVLLVNDNFASIGEICHRFGFFPVHGVLFDLGLSSYQLDDDRRGFSFQQDAVLDMRFDPNLETTAADIVNGYAAADLARLLRDYGEEVYSQRIVRRIVQKRPVKTTLQLARLVEEAVGGRRGKIHPATKTFQALRIAVNRELERLAQALDQVISLLGTAGRLVVISYHSLEDRIVKQFMHRESRDCICPSEVLMCRCGHRASLRPVNRKVVLPTAEEIKENPRARSARLRAAEKISGQGEADIAKPPLPFRGRSIRFSPN